MWIIGIAFVVCVGTLVIQNFLWIGQTCSVDPTTAVCENKSVMRSFYSELETCKASMEKNSSAFSCSKGPTVEKMGPRLSAVETHYFSMNDQLEKRKSLLSAKSQPVILMFLASVLLVVMLWRLVFRLRQKPS